MLALVADGGRAEIREVDSPRARPGFARIRVLLSGICNTDLELVRGYNGFSGVLGHEFVGEVVGPSSSALLGQRVAGEISLSCWRCPTCLGGLPRHCPRRKVLGIQGHPGAHAELLTLPERNLHVIPESLRDEEAVFVEPLAAACQVLEQVEVTSRTRAAVLGAGKLGSLVAQVLSSAGAGVTLFGRGDAQSARAQKGGFDLVVEATGSPAGMPLALALVRPRGTIVWKSTHHVPARFDAAPLVVKEVTVVGSRCGPFPAAIQLLASRRVDVSSLLSAELPLSKAVSALRLAARPGVRKVLLRPG